MSLRRVAKNIVNAVAVQLVDDLIIPWYSSKQGTVEQNLKISIRDEVALKLEEALAGVLWSRKHEDFQGVERFCVERVEARLEDRGYSLMLTVSDEGGMETEVFPLHVFLQTFQPVDEVNEADYDS